MNTVSERIVRSLARQGFRLVSTNRHVKLQSPEGAILIVPSTMGRGRGMRNLEAVVRRLGYEIVAPKVGARGSRRGSMR